MLKKARLKVAESIKKIEKPDDWQWKRWLKKPSVSKVGISMSQAEVGQENLFKDTFKIPKVYLKPLQVQFKGLVEKKQFDRWLKVKATKTKSAVIPIPKTNPVFYRVVKAKVSQNFVPEDEQAKITYSLEVKNFFPETTTKHVKVKEKETPTYKKFFHEEMLNKNFAASWSYAPENTECIDLKNKFDIESQNQIDLKNKFDIKSQNQIDLKNKFEITNKAKVEQKNWIEKFVSKQTEVSLSLLPTSKDSSFVGNEIISKYYFTGTEITSNLLITSSFTYDITLLNVGKFEVNISDLRFDIMATQVVKSDMPEDAITLIKDSEKISRISIDELPVANVSRNLGTTILIKTEQAPIIKVGFDETPSIHSFKEQQFDILKPVTYEQDLSFLFSITPTEKPNLQYEKKLFDGLTNYQKDGIDFLINHPLAVLADEHGLGKTIQIVNALEFLLNRKRIKTVLLLTNNPELGNPNIITYSRNPEGWDGHFNHWTPNLKTTTLFDKETARIKKWNSANTIFISGYEGLKSDFESDTLPADFFKKFDCIVLDDYHTCKNYPIIKNIVASSRPKYLWVISGMLKKELDDEVEKSINNLYYEIYGKKLTGDEWKELYTANRLQRTISEEKKALPDRVYHNKWFSLKEEQLKEHEGIIQEGEITIYSTIERGNYYIVRPQIFNILHQLKQISNFSSKEINSGKAKELLMHIQSTDEKVIVFSQYEKLGLDRLEKLFTNNKISFVLYKTGMREDALEKAILDFRENRAKIFLADVKAVQKKINLGQFSTIIHFDHWWNPNAVWQLEDKIHHGTNKNPINVYYYWTEGTVEGKIYLKLSERGLFYKTIYESLSVSTIADMISVEEWLEMFNIKVEETSDLKVTMDIPSKIKLIEQYSQDELREISKKFLMKIGFGSTKFLKYDDNSPDDVSLASKMVGNKEENILVLIRSEKTTGLDTLASFLNSFSDYRNISKTFIITSGTFTEECKRFVSFSSKTFTLIDRTLFANILSLFNLL